MFFSSLDPKVFLIFYHCFASVVLIVGLTSCRRFNSKDRFITTQRITIISQIVLKRYVKMLQTGNSTWLSDQICFFWLIKFFLIRNRFVDSRVTLQEWLWGGPVQKIVCRSEIQIGTHGPVLGIIFYVFLFHICTFIF